MNHLSLHFKLVAVYVEIKESTVNTKHRHASF